MEHFAADAIKADRDAHIRAAIKANTPWTDLAESYGITVEEIMRITEKMHGATRRGSSLIVPGRNGAQKGPSKDDGWD
jgi:hypothetical protein